MNQLARPFRVLLYGKDARTDALAAACAASGSAPELFAYSELEIPGLLEKCKRLYTGSLTDTEMMAAVARDVEPDLAVIGPEEPLVAGLVDALDSIGIRSFGPSRDLARIEGSKSWARQLLDKYAISGNPRYRVFTTGEGLSDYLRELRDFVVKPDGLTGGKGVKVFGEHLDSILDASEYASELLSVDGRVVIEERLDGEEFSLQTITDGRSVVHCPLVQDHKRAEEGDTGPNTGGMGSYSCADHSLPFITPSDLDNARRINVSVINALASETGRPYRGVLYGGFIATRDGIRLIEYNARFGDPEALNVLPILRGDFTELCRATSDGRLDPATVSFETKATVCKYVVPENYPGGKGEGDQIHVKSSVLDDPDIRCYWAATRQQESDVLLTGSRAVAFVGIGDTLEDAEARAEQGARSVRGPVRHRSDIGRPSLIADRIAHMRALREVSEART